MGPSSDAPDWTGMAGRTVVVTGLKNRKSVAWHVTRQLEEVGAEVIDGPQSVVFDQAENRLHAQKAIMVKLMGRR